MICIGYIYKITNTVNGKMYIGQTRQTIARRWTEHKQCSKSKNLGYESLLYQAMKKYGIKSFVVEEVEECSDELLNDREIYWIAHYGTVENGYNISRGGFGHPRDPIQIAQFDLEGNYIRTICSTSEAAKMVGANPQMIYNACRGEKHSAHGFQWRFLKDAENLGMKLKPIKVSPKYREIHQYTKDGEYIRSFDSIAQAAKQFGIKGSGGIKSVCDGRSRHSHGYRWSYEKVDKLPPIRKDKSNRPVAKLDDNGNIIKIYPTMTEAGKDHNRSICAIQAVCDGRYSTCAGYKWKYYETA